MQMKLKLTAAAALALTAGIVSAQDVQVVKIGHVAPMSGGQAHYGKDNENGARMAVEELNTQNITIGGKKIKFELQAEDDAADPKQGTAAAQKLCDSKVNAVVGHLNSGTTIPASKVYNDCGVPMVTGAATNPNLTKPGYKTTFRIIANDNALGAGLASYTADTLKLKTVAVVAPDDYQETLRQLRYTQSLLAPPASPPVDEAFRRVSTGFSRSAHENWLKLGYRAGFKDFWDAARAGDGRSSLVLGDIRLQTQASSGATRVDQATVFSAMNLQPLSALGRQLSWKTSLGYGGKLSDARRKAHGEIGLGLAVEHGS